MGSPTRGAGAVRLEVADVAGLDTAPRRSTCRISASCAGGFGTVIPSVRPSWLTPVPRISGVESVAVAQRGGEGLSSTMPAPSPRP